ncbi:MAG: hypothetical protein NZ933_07520, partial [Bacteroidia bacterium]|nr:hypothetical protein [Bacteroidia bacterium]
MIVAVLTLLYWPLTLRPRHRIRNAVSLQECAADPYCAPNLSIIKLRLIVANPDTPSYFDPVYRFLRGEGYQPDFRLPGYGIVYGFFYMISKSRFWAFWGTAIFQFCMWCLALALWLTEAEKRGVPKTFIYIITVLICFSPIAFYTRALLTEALSVSMGLLALYALYKRHYVCAGIAVGWAFFMRPVLGVWLLPGTLWIIYRERP